MDNHLEYCRKQADKNLENLQDFLNNLIKELEIPQDSFAEILGKKTFHCKSTIIGVLKNGFCEDWKIRKGSRYIEELCKQIQPTIETYICKGKSEEKKQRVKKNWEQNKTFYLGYLNFLCSSMQYMEAPLYLNEMFSDENKGKEVHTLIINQDPENFLREIYEDLLKYLKKNINKKNGIPTFSQEEMKAFDNVIRVLNGKT